jgi:hypothetical protein
VGNDIALVCERAFLPAPAYPSLEDPVHKVS